MQYFTKKHNLPLLNKPGIYMFMFKHETKPTFLYIGQSITVRKRINGHLQNLRSGTHKNPIIQNYFDKYGENAFNMFAIQYAPKEQLNDLETFYINHFDCINPKGFNLREGGDSDYTVLDSTREKISEAHKGENSVEWGTSIIEEYGGLWFIETFAKLDIGITYLCRCIGVHPKTLMEYLGRRGTSWHEVSGIKLQEKNTQERLLDIGGVEFLKEQAQNGVKLEDIAKDLEMSVDSIIIFLRNNGTSYNELKIDYIEEWGGLSKIKEYANNNHTKKEIADEVGMTPSSIDAYLKRNGTSWKEVTHGVSVIDQQGGLDKINKLVKDGLNMKQVANEFNITVSGLQNYLHARNTSFSELKNGKKQKNVTPAQQKVIDAGGLDYIISKISAGWSRKQVAADIGVSTDTITSFLKNNNVTWKELDDKYKKSKYELAGGNDYVIKRARLGVSFPKIAEEMGITKNSLEYNLTKQGLKMSELRKK